MLSNLFFGYLPLKWKRLARVLSFVLFPVLVLILASLDVINIEDEDEIFVSCIVLLISILLISFVLKPFVVKD